MSSLETARASLLQRLAVLLELLRELQTPAGRQRVRLRLQAAARARRRARRARPGTVRPVSLAAGARAWRPRDLAERVARRARRAGGMQPHRAGSDAGGQTVRERYGAAFYRSIGARGGSTVLEERGVAYLQDIGARGGAATRQRYGPEHYAEIGRKGGLAGRGRKRPRKRPGQLGLPLAD